MYHPKKEAVSHYERGKEYYQDGNIEQAFLSWKNSIDLDPNYVYPWLGLGVVYNDLKQYNAAIEAYQKAIELDPNLAPPWNGLGNAHFDLKQYNKAIEAFQKAIELDLNFAYPWNGSGNVYNDLKQYNKAIEAYQKAIELNPNYADPWQGLGMVYKDLKQYNKAIEAYQKAIELDPNDADPWQRLGMVYNELKQYQLAIEAYQKSLVLDPNLAHSWHGLANTYYIINQYQVAMKCYQKAKELKPNNSHVWHGLRNVYYGLNQYQAALEANQKAVELDPNIPFLWFGLGEVYERLEQYKASIEAYRKGIELNPNFADSWYGLGKVYAALNQYQVAIKAYQKAVELDPNFFYPQTELGNVYFKLKQYNIAMGAYQKSIELEPNYANSWYGLGNIYINFKQYKEAKEAYQKAININPNNAYFWHGLGNVYERLNKYQVAIEAFQKAIALDLNYAYPWNMLGGIYNKRKQYKAAIEAYQKAIEIDLNYDHPWSGLGNVYCNIEQYQTAIIAYQKAIKLDPNCAYPWHGLGYVYVKLNEGYKTFLCYAMFESLADKEELRDLLWTLIGYYKDLGENYLAFRITKSNIDWQSYISHNDFFQKTYEAFHETDLFLQHLKLYNYKQNNHFEYDLIDGLLAFHLNDPIRAFQIFDERLDIEGQEYNMQVQYYLLLSAFDTDFVIEEFKAVKTDVMKKSLEVLENLKKYNDQQIYYTGLCWLFFKEPEKSLSCFELLPDFLPAKIHAICCRSQLGQDTKEAIEQILSINQRTEFLNLLHQQGFNTSKDPFEEVLHFIYRKEIGESLGDIQAYVKENEKLHPEIDWESLSYLVHNPFLEENSKKQLAMDYRLIINEECEKIKTELSSDSLFYQKNFSVFLKLKDQALENKIGNRIKEASKSVEYPLNQFINTITYFHFSSKLNHKQKARLIYWLYAQYHLSNKKDKSIQTITKIILNLSFAYFCQPYVVALLFIPELMVPVIGEAVSHSIGKAVEKMLTNINEDFPETYDLFKDRIDEILGTSE